MIFPTFRDRRSALRLGCCDPSQYFFHFENNAGVIIEVIGVSSQAKKSEVLKLLKKVGLQVVAQLTFAKHMYDVRAPEDVDPFDLAESLRRKKICEFAIPELIERIQSLRSVRKLSVGPKRLDS